MNKLSFRLKGENLKGLTIIAFNIIGQYDFPIILKKLQQSLSQKVIMTVVFN